MLTRASVSDFSKIFDPETQRMLEEELRSRGIVPCPCWATGKYVWVEGCEGHPRESIT